jgi:membrane protein implicated in regulation of membrane protease activity
MSGLFSSILGFLGLEAITGVDLLFAGSAIVGTILFLIYFILVLVGGVADGAMDALGFDIDLDVGAEGIFHMLTIQGLLSFMMMFGIFGLGVSQSNDNVLYAIGAGTVAGIGSMWVIGKVFQMMKSLETDGTVKYHEAIGAKGKVYQTIFPGESGQVQVEFTGALRTVSAVSQNEEEKIATGKFIKVVDHIGETLIVKSISVTTASDSEE